MLKKYSVFLPDFEREKLTFITKKGQAPAYRIKHAQILLNADQNGPYKSDNEIAGFLKCHPQTVYNVRKRYHEKGLEWALDRKKRETPPVKPIIDSCKEAELFAIANSPPPEGSTRWTFKLLSERMVELGIVATISPKTVERTLKKPRKITSSKR